VRFYVGKLLERVLKDDARPSFMLAIRVTCLLQIGGNAKFRLKRSVVQIYGSNREIVFRLIRYISRF
jgi:hypothetical protein